MYALRHAPDALRFSELQHKQTESIMTPSTVIESQHLSMANAPIPSQPAPGTLTLSLGTSSLIGPKPRNEDALACVTPEPAELAGKGALVVLADGVSACADGRLAAQSSVSAVVADYYATPETWAAAQALDKLLTAQNGWLRAQQGGQLLTTLTALVLRGRRFTAAHVGDTRLYRLRNDELKLLTQDHAWDQPGMQHVLKRALGLDEHLVLDFIDGELAEGDLFLLASDGVWAALGDMRLHEVLRLYTSTELAAKALTDAAQLAGSNDNMSAIVVRVEALPPLSLGDELSGAADLPLPPRLKPGQVFEGLTVEGLLHESRASLLYKVTDAGGRAWVLKTLLPLLDNDEDSQQGLLREEWLQKRLTSHYFCEVKPLPERQHLYYLLRWHDGMTLNRWRTDHDGPLAPAEVVRVGIRLARALGVLHRLNIVHRDIKPENLHLDQDGKLRVLDLGVAYCPGLNDEASSWVPGTPSFMAPEMFDGERASVQSDLYAAGVTLYWLLTGHYPYGEVEPFQHPRFGEPVPASRYRPDIPAWLDLRLLKAVARDPKQRFETAEEFLLALERGDALAHAAPRRLPLAERAPLKLWQTVALVSLGINLLLLYWLMLGH
jgi:serine/threonine protein phosphatase PrpC